MSATTFSIIGGGWRTEFFMRIAAALPERFRVGGVLVRDPIKARAFASRWRVPVFGTLDELLRGIDGKFVVTSVPSEVNVVLLRELTQRDMPVLSETPAAHDVETLAAVGALTKEGARIQIAEQCHLRPVHAARIALARSGLLGRVTQAQVSVAHGYHGISIIRRLLDIGFEDAAITAKRFESPMVEGPGREGPLSEERVVSSAQDLAWFEFGDRLGVFDFTGRQYFSRILSSRVMVRGDRGEINDEHVRYLKDFRTPVHLQLRRVSAGEDDNLEDPYLRGILAGDSWVYENPFAPGCLSDDEIAIAVCLEKMAAYVDGGPDFYSLAEGCQDTYLSLLLSRAIETGERIVSERQPWAV